MYSARRATRLADGVADLTLDPGPLEGIGPVDLRPERLSVALRRALPLFVPRLPGPVTTHVDADSADFESTRFGYLAVGDE